MKRLHKILLLLSPLALAPAAAYPFFGSTAKPLCFSAGAATYQLSAHAVAPDYRVRIDDAAARPDLRMQAVDRPELADFVIADEDGAAEEQDCAAGAKVIRTDAGEGAADVTVSLAAGAQADFKIYVRSQRYSERDAAALLAAMWKAAQARGLASAR
jgi:hypothetical protein